MEAIRADALQPDLGTSTLELLIKQFLADDRPWVVAYSGGKDSTLVLQLVYEMLLQLGSRAKKPVFVISSDTRVEAPNISKYVERTLELIENNSRARGLALSVCLVKPTAEESFWGKLIGKGYPSPTRWFRWCTSNMKIKPSRRAIDEITRQYGSVILLLGTRQDESDSRRTRMQARGNNDRQLNPHHEIPDALVMTPIATWSTDEVWEYLFTHNSPPWGGNHDYMLSLYRQASGGECPVVLDLNTPSCGGSRFGCWTCTVVSEDKALSGLIANDNAELEPLLKFRNWLYKIRDEEDKREKKRVNGQVYYIGEGENRRIGLGPFT
ncbi:MAG TPA: DNA phosphorothioation system sulfurtransferase DndC, partial [Xanthomonadaceae bacterium]|nr:DNA phosphorothioation system sulfurtransferase DndC [Xanthomonadaceae bacterium]